MNNNIFKIIILLCIFSILLTACNKREEDEPSTTTTTTIESETEDTESKSNSVIYSEDTTTDISSPTDISSATSSTVTTSKTAQSNKTINNKTNSSKTNNKSKPTTLAYNKDAMLTAACIVNGSNFYQNEEVFTIIKISTLTSDKLYATSEESFEAIDGQPIGINFKTPANNIKPGDIIRIKGIFKNNEINNVTILEVNGAAKTEYNKDIKEQHSAQMKYDTDLTWAKATILPVNSFNNVRYRAKITISDPEECTALFSGHIIKYMATDKTFRLQKGKTYYVYGIAAKTPIAAATGENDICFFIGYAEQIY